MRAAMPMFRRTKLVATLGPATDDPKIIDRLIAAGVDVVRLNFSHASPEAHFRRANAARASAEAQGRPVGVLVDLQGPKIRIGRFTDHKVLLEEGQPFIIDVNWPLDRGDR